MHGLRFAQECSTLLKRLLKPCLNTRSLSRQYGTLRSASLTPSDAQKSTIFALSTPPGKAGVAIIRLSGPDTRAVWDTVVRTTRASKALTPWKLERCRVVDPENGEVLDDGLAVFFKGPKSFTTEDVLELHVHSGGAVIRSVLAALGRVPGLRHAEPGEFTRRAFHGGRLDLTQVEGLKDIINAETDVQRRLAQRVAAGDVRMQYEALREDIIRCLAMVEALIDFGEGEDIEEGVYEQARDRVLKLHTKIHGLINDRRKGELMREGVRVAIFGPPNVGKSSLLNYLAQRDAAIVTPVPGTTRDVMELVLDVDGLPVRVADTAGVRATDDVVEQIGVQRARQWVQGADASVCVLSIPELVSGARAFPDCIPADLRELVKPDTIFLLNKLDSLPDSAQDVLQHFPSERTWLCSVQTGDRMQLFMDGFAATLRERYDVDGASDIVITHARHRAHLESALRFLSAFLESGPEDVVIAAEELRYAAQAVGKITGLIDVEEVLGAVFSEFCIGK